jgi:DNA-directed RNA polymerase subunit beta
MLTIKSDDVYGRSKAYESIIKKTEIVGPKVPESFNVLVKELQGLGLKVDLVQSDKVVDAEAILSENIKDEAAHQAEVEVPAPMISEIDVTEDAVADEFVMMDMENGGEADMIDDEVSTEDAAVVSVDDEESEEA